MGATGDYRPSPTRSLLRAVVMLALAIVILAGLTTVAIVRVFNQSASQAQLARVQARQAANERQLKRVQLRSIKNERTLAHSQSDSCHVFRFVEQRLLVTPKTRAERRAAAKFETPAQRRAARQFAGQLHHAVSDCTRAGYK